VRVVKIVLSPPTQAGNRPQPQRSPRELRRVFGMAVAVVRDGPKVRMTFNADWIGGNQVQLLENGDAFYPSVFDAIDRAERDVLIETFILFEDRVGRLLQQHLIDAAARGVVVDLTVDGFGSPNLSADFVSAMTDAGVRVHVYDPTPLIRQLKPLRRLHRKIVVVDSRVAFVGGINFSEDQLEDCGAKAKQDYAVRIEGPLVDRIHRFASQALEPVKRQAGLDIFGGRAARKAARQAVPETQQPLRGGVQMAFVIRDNFAHRADIESAYRSAIRAARDTVWIANAYFFPGYRLLRELRRAARRGVTVRLILQKDPDVPIARFAARLLYDGLMKEGVTVHEYCRREMHGKVAVVDGVWATVGSANLDPLSLSLNLEANVLIRDAEFAATLERRLRHLIEHECEQLNADSLPRWTMWRYVTGALAYHIARRFPRWLRWLSHPRLRFRSFVGKKSVDVEVVPDAAAAGDVPSRHDAGDHTPGNRAMPVRENAS
jgi:cardiolipin synthase